jgi:hypothetical protein
MLKELKAKHREVARLALIGEKPNSIAEQLDMPVQTVYQIQRDPLYKSHLANLSDSVDTEAIRVRKELAMLSLPAVRALRDLITFEDMPPAVILGAAKDILDRNGYAAPKTVNMNHTVLTGDDLARLRERAISAGATIEAEYECEPSTS